MESIFYFENMQKNKIDLKNFTNLSENLVFIPANQD